MEIPCINKVVLSLISYLLSYLILSYLILHKLQLVLNCAARLVVGGCKYVHITPLLRVLHWLLVEHRTTFKLLLISS